VTAKLSSDALGSNGEARSRRWAHIRKLGDDRWMPRILVALMALVQVYSWEIFLFTGSQRAGANIPYVIFIAISAFALTAQVTHATVVVVSSPVRDRIYWIFTAVLALHTFLLILVSFATLYWTIGTTANFGINLSRLDAVYSALGMLTTAGTGDIVPVSQLARGFVSGQMFFDFVFVVVALALVLTKWAKSLAKRRPGRSLVGHRSHYGPDRRSLRCPLMQHWTRCLVASVPATDVPA
jgi:hypothetical protein